MAVSTFTNPLADKPGLFAATLKVIAGVPAVVTSSVWNTSND
ncbi:MAG: hypothetical protein VYD53_10960 [Pseudomonadota bacterium]|nr:hypothetical protein [Pseudomonadota bacterium]